MIRAVTALLSTCSRRVSRAARKLRGAHGLPLSHQLKLLASRPLFPRRVAIPFIGGERRRKKKIPEERREKIGDELDGFDDEEVWRRGIIMGEKCQPLDFSGVIYYDPDGRQLARAPVPKSPMRSPLRSLLAEDKAWM